MQVKLRLQRIGRKGNPFYRAVAISSTKSRSGQYLEVVGTYNPMLPKDNQDRIKLSLDRINYWVKCGAQLTKTMARLVKNFSDKASKNVEKKGAVGTDNE